MLLLPVELHRPAAPALLLLPDGGAEADGGLLAVGEAGVTPRHVPVDTAVLTAVLLAAGQVKVVQLEGVTGQLLHGAAVRRRHLLAVHGELLEPVQSVPLPPARGGPEDQAG